MLTSEFLQFFGTIFINSIRWQIANRAWILRATTFVLLSIVLMLAYPEEACAQECAQRRNISLFLAIDISSSMEGAKLIAARDFAVNIIDELNATGYLFEASSIQFCREIIVQNPWMNPSNLRNGIANLAVTCAYPDLSYYDGTSLYGAIIVGANELRTRSSSNLRLLVVITDGEDTSSSVTAADAANALSGGSIVSRLVFIGSSVSAGSNALASIATAAGPSSQAMAASASNLSSLVANIRDATCTNFRPDASMSLSDSTLHLGVDGFSIFFDGSGSHDVETSDFGLDFSWTFTRPNNTTFTHTGISFSQTFDDSQLPYGDQWTVRLTVSDPSGVSDTTSQSFRVIGSPPEITITGGTNITVLQDIALQISPLSDIDGGGNWKEVRWDILQSPPNSSRDPLPAGPSLSFTTVENDIGTWKLRATATDNEGDTGSAEVTVEVDNLPPEINLTGLTQIDVGETISLETTIIEDRDGGLLEFEWDIVQAPQSASISVQENYSGGTGTAGAVLSLATDANSAGTWIFALKATDNEGDSITDEHTILVDGPDEAAISGPETIGFLHFPLILDGSDSIDYDSPCPEDINRCHNTLDGRAVTVSPGLSYSWFLVDVPFELRSDYPLGRVDEVFRVPAYEPTLTLQFFDLAPGDWTFQLEVFDAEGNQDFTIYTVSVIDENGPPIALLSPPARYITDVSGNLDRDIVISGNLSFDPDNILPGSPPLPGITNYRWDIINGPSSCTPAPTLLSGSDQDTVTLFTAAVPPPCHGIWQIGLTVTDDDSTRRNASAATTVIIGNCLGAICVDYPTTLNPQFVEFSENTDIIIYYHMDSALYDDPLFIYGMYAKLEIFHESNPTTPVFTSVNPNPLPTDKGGVLVFHWNGYSNSLARPQPGFYTVKINLVDSAFDTTTFETIELEAIWLTVAQPEILPTSDRYVGFTDLNTRVDQIDLNYEIIGVSIADELRWRVYDASNSVIFEQSEVFSTSGTIVWDGRISSSNNSIPPAEYMIELEVYRSGISLGKSAPQPLFVIASDIRTDLNRDGTFSEDDPDEGASPGMLIFINSDDDDGNGSSDHSDPGSASENDLLDIRLTGIPATVDAGTLVLEAMQGVNQIKVWSSPGKGQGNLIFDSTTGKKEWVIGRDINTFGDLPNTLYVEAVGTRTTVGDVVLQMRYEFGGNVLGSDQIVITVITENDIALYESAQPINSAVVYGEKAGSTKTLLFYHDCPTLGNETKGTASLMLTFQSPPRLLYRYDKLELITTTGVAMGSLGSVPVSTTLEYYDDTEGDWSPDMRVLIGIDTNQNGILDDSEARVMFSLHLVTDDNYNDSISEINNDLLVATDMADALLRRFVTGSFSGADPDFIPVSGGSITVGARGNGLYSHMFTHNFGAVFTGTGSTSMATVPVFEYLIGSSGSDLVSSTDDVTGGYRTGIVDFMTQNPAFSYSNVDAMFQSLGGGPVNTTHRATFTNLEIGMQMGIVSVGLGRVTAEGSISVDITRTGTSEYTLHDVRAVLTIEDLNDYSYFQGGVAGTLGENQNGASVQAGFGRCGNPTGVGEVFLTRVMTDRTFNGVPLSSTAPITITKAP